MSVAPSTILIVDDDPLVQGAIQALLNRAGHKTRVANDGEVALAAMAAAPCDVVILDILMPRKEGLETLIELKRLYPKIRVIAMSASVVRKHNDFLAIATKFGADAILRKPFTESDLLNAVSRVVAKCAETRATAGHG
jgi:CheY-like chemotaxis protein